MSVRKLLICALALVLVSGCRLAEVRRTAGELLRENCAEVHAGEGYAGAVRYNFTFEGYKAYFDEPVNAKPGRKWMWCMKWPNAFAEFTGQVNGVERGYYYVYLDDIDWMSEKGVAVAKRFHDFLVKKLGFADKAFLIGMSWGGFYSTRYAANHPEDVASIYLDAPLMNFGAFGLDRWNDGEKAWGRPENGDWNRDSRMPVNLADRIAKAKIPVLLLYGGADTVVPPAGNCELFTSRFKAAGGDIQVFRREKFEHHPHGFTEPQKRGAVVDFFEGARLK